MAEKFVIEFETVKVGSGEQTVVKGLDQITASGKVTAKQLAYLRVELDEAGKAANRTEAELRALADAEKAFEKMTARLQAQKTALFNLNDETKEAIQRNRGLSETLFDGASKMEQLKSAIVPTAAALAGGFAVGLKVAAAAGEDLSATMEFGKDVFKGFSSILNHVIGGPFRMLGDIIAVETQGISDFGNAFRRAEGPVVSLLQAVEDLKKRGWVATLPDAKAHMKILQGISDAAWAAAKAERALSDAKVDAAKHSAKMDEVGGQAALVMALQDKLATLKALHRPASELWAVEEELHEIEKKSVEQWKTNGKKAKEEELAAAHKIAAALEKQRDANTALSMAISKGTSFAKAKGAADAKIADNELKDAIHRSELRERTDKYLKEVDIAMYDARKLGEKEYRAEVQETAALQREAAVMQMERTVTMANAIIGLAGQIFGDTKEGAVASAIVNTYEGATKAYAQGGIYGAALAAIVVAGGMMQVQKIMSTEAPKSEEVTAPSFDDPVNDAVARRAGQASAIDLVNHVNQGFTSALGMGNAQRQNGNTTSATLGPLSAKGASRGGGVVINVSGSFPSENVIRATRREMAKFDRKIETQVRGNRSKRIR